MSLWSIHVNLYRSIQLSSSHSELPCVNKALRSDCFMDCPQVINHGWEIPELNGGFSGKIIEPQAMIDWAVLLIRICFDKVIRFRFFWGDSCFSAVPASLLFCFSCFSVFYVSCCFAFLLLCCSCFSLFCFSAFPPFAFPASLLLCFCAFLLLLFTFSAVMCFCCSTSSCSLASLLPFFILYLCFSYSFTFYRLLFVSLMKPKGNPRFPRWNPKTT